MTVSELQAAVAVVVEETEKFEGGNKAAGTRARKALMEVKKLTDTMRKDIQAKKNA